MISTHGKNTTKRFPFPIIPLLLNHKCKPQQNNVLISNKNIYFWYFIPLRRSNVKSKRENKWPCLLIGLFIIYYHIIYFNKTPKHINTRLVVERFSHFILLLRFVLCSNYFTTSGNRAIDKCTNKRTPRRTNTYKRACASHQLHIHTHTHTHTPI
jgi:hypothetical protein